MTALQDCQRSRTEVYVIRSTGRPGNQSGQQCGQAPTRPLMAKPAPKVQQQLPFSCDHNLRQLCNGANLADLDGTLCFAGSFRCVPEPRTFSCCDPLWHCCCSHEAYRPAARPAPHRNRRHARSCTESGRSIPKHCSDSPNKQHMMACGRLLLGSWRLSGPTSRQISWIRAPCSSYRTSAGASRLSFGKGRASSCDYFNYATIAGRWTRLTWPSLRRAPESARTSQRLMLRALCGPSCFWQWSSCKLACLSGTQRCFLLR